jgi:redox-sensing transcriptional repressor
MISDKTVGRLSLYRRTLQRVLAEGREYVFSHEIAHACGVTAAQVRRDLMPTGFAGTPKRGYSVAALLQSIGNLLDDPEKQCVALVGIGNLGRAILAYFTGRRPNLAIVAAFDQDPNKVNQMIHGCRCYPMEQVGTIIEEKRIEVAIIAVPASAAQAIADRLVSYGVRGFLNFAPASLRVPSDIYVEDLDMAISLERVAYFAHHGVSGRRQERLLR